jgi:hypothetical protein
MPSWSRRTFLLSGLALAAARLQAQPPASAAQVRRPSASQWWRYIQRDGFHGGFRATQVDWIQMTNGTTRIDRHNEAAPASGSPTPSAPDWLEPYRAQPGAEILPYEIQQPWGSVLVDPHWDIVQIYETPIPLWPRDLRSGGRERFNTRYHTPAESSWLAWQQTMVARGWERIRVPAGEFHALRYTNEIIFTHTDFARYQSLRNETLWLAPEVGRWVARESRGTYYINDSSIAQPFNEDFWRWELLDWA